LLKIIVNTKVCSWGITVVAESDVSCEPTNCYTLAWTLLSLNTDQAIKLCSGATDTSKAVGYFLKAPEPEDGLGLPMGFAVNLCKTNFEPF